MSAAAVATNLPTGLLQTTPYAINHLNLTNAVQPIAYQLRDIHGLDPIPWWPPAPGWWLLIGGVLLSLWIARHWLPPIHSKTLGDVAWRWDAANKLRSLRWRVRRQQAQTSASELSELLRRIAMARYGRDACAGLTGKAWLAWLMEHDPVGYAWPERGLLLLAAPYAPPNLATADASRLLELIDATKRWLNPTKLRETKQTDV